jgi:hypothetical protein
MLKKMTLLAISVFALVAFAAPAVAQAQQLYQLKNGKHVALSTGVEVTATSTNLVTTETATGEKLECMLVTIHGTVSKNEAATAHISNNSVTVSGCNHSITDATIGTITIDAGTVGLGDGATFEVDGLCHFSGNIPFSYLHDTNVLTIAGIDQLNSAACGTAQIAGSFKLETSNTMPVFIE